MSVRLKSFIRISLSLALAVLFVYLAFRGSDFGKLKAALAEANYLWAVLLVPCLFVSHLFRAWRWRYLVGPIKEGVSLRNLFSSLLIGYMVNNALPRVGELVRSYNLGRLEGISKASVFGTVLTERILDMLSFLLCLAIILLASGPRLSEALPWLGSAGLILLIVVFSVIAILVFLLARRDLALRWLEVILGRFSRKTRARVQRGVRSLLDGFLVIKDRRRYVVIGMLTLIIWFWYSLMMYLPFLAFEMVDRYEVHFLSAVVVMVVTAIGYIIPAPGATGTYHWIARETLVGLYNVDVEVALSYATVTHLLSFVAVTLVGLFYFLRDNLRVSDALRGGEGEVAPGEEG
jgi:uncharacterized protein (TIRG00374 family)